MADIYNIGEFLGIAQHRDGSLLNTGTAIDARNMDTSDGNLSVAKGYVRKSGNAIPSSAGQILRIIPVDESNILAVTQNSIYHGTYDTWNLTPIYTFETTLPVTCQIGYALGKINTTNVVVIGTGKTQLIKVNMGDTVTAEIFGSGLYIFETTVSAYDSATKIVTLADAMSQDIQQKFVVEKGVYINGVFRKGSVTSDTTITLDTTPGVAPVTGDTVKLRGGASDAHCNFVCMHNGRLFAAGDPDAPNRLYWSTIPGDGRTIEHWLAIESSVDLSGGYVEVGDTTADPIIGICELSTQILIFKRYSIYRLYGDRPSYYTVERVEKFTENMSNAGVAVKTDIPYWLTKSGIKLFNGADMQLLDGGQNYLCSINEIMQHEVPERYGWIAAYWEESIGFYVSEDKLTQFHILHLLAELIHQATLLGWTEEEVMDELNYIEDSLQESEKDVCEGKVDCRPFEEILKAHGWPVPEKDEEKEDLERAADDSKIEYERYCYINAAKRVRELLAESGKE